MISPFKIVTRIDVVQDVFDKFMRSDCSFHSDNWEIVEDDRNSTATWSGNEKHQKLKANFDEANVAAKAANAERKIKLNELRDYERSK